MQATTENALETQDIGGALNRTLSAEKAKLGKLSNEIAKTVGSSHTGELLCTEAT